MDDGPNSGLSPEQDERSSLLLVFPAASEKDIEKEASNGIIHRYEPFFLAKSRIFGENPSVPAGLNGLSVDGDATKSILQQMPLDDLEDLYAEVEHFRTAFANGTNFPSERSLEGVEDSKPDVLLQGDPADDIVPGAVCLSVGTDGTVEWTHKRSGDTMNGISIYPPDCRQDYENRRADAATGIHSAFEHGLELSGQSILGSAMGTINQTMGSKLAGFSDVILSILSARGTSANSDH